MTVAPGGSLTFTIDGTASATGLIINTASVAAPNNSSARDRNLRNNIAIDIDAITLPDAPLPSLPVLDTFGRSNSNSLGPNWTQGGTSIRVVSNTAQAANGNGLGRAIWTGPGLGRLPGRGVHLRGAAGQRLEPRA